ncbi:MAG TPA: DUF3095 domain-containing protein, partial [Chitinophagaceae bacterium]|nr:DUF3095 domain-containing protein [Chitinophagaceae bacterium]
FYAKLPVNHLSLSELLLKDELFYKVPADWYIIITDIKSSTSAVKKGLHENVNLIAAGSIVSLLNMAFRDNILVPFFFGGDGATFIVPSNLIKKVMPALLLFRDQTMANFNLELRIGNIAVQKIYEKGYELNICKFGLSEFFPVPIILGGGLNYAESVIKGDDYLLAGHPIQEEELDLNGMQCRWDRIPPPENKEEVVTLLVVARDGHLQKIIFSQVMQQVDEIYGSPGKRQPISISKLKLKTSFNRLGKEMRARIGRIKYFDIISLWFISLWGSLYFKTQKGKRYLNRLVEMSDTLVIDGKINTVMSGTAKQRTALQDALNDLESAGKIYYGIHVSNSSIMSCYVRDMKDGHIHFVDGSEGGYTMAAGMLKNKLRK